MCGTCAPNMAGWTNEQIQNWNKAPDPVRRRMEKYIENAKAAGLIAGASPDAPTTTTPQGGKHSLVEADFTQLDGPAIAKIAEIMYQGSAKYGRDNWRAISDREHINHALMHLFADQSEDTQDDHLAHALTRLMFAMATRLRPGFLGEFADPSVHPIVVND